MKFCDMPYERVDFEKAKEELLGLMQEFQEAKSGEEQFEIHRKYYKLADRVSTQMTIASIRHDSNTVDEFYDEEKKYYDEQGPIYQNLILAYEKLLYDSPYRVTVP